MLCCVGPLSGGSGSLGSLAGGPPYKFATATLSTDRKRTFFNMHKYYDYRTTLSNFSSICVAYFINRDFMFST